MNTEKKQTLKKILKNREVLNEQLVKGIQQKDITKKERDKLLVKLYDLNMPLFESLGRQWLKNRYNSYREDVMSLSYEILHNCACKFNTKLGVKFSTYLFTSLRNKLENETARKSGEFMEVKNRYSFRDSHSSYEPNTDSDIDFDLLTDKLTPIERDVLRLRYSDDLKYKDISGRIYEIHKKMYSDKELYVIANKAMTQIKDQLKTD